MVLDLSLLGVYVASEQQPEVGEEVMVSFRVPGNSRELELGGLVAWLQANQAHPVHDLPRGFGIRFLRLDLSDVRLISSTIRSYCQSNPIYRQYL